MSRSDVVIRPAVTDDLGAIAHIYAHHVLTGVATFELTPPDEDEWRSRFDAVTDRELPFVTPALDGNVAGYGFGAPWKLVTECGRAGVRQIIAIIVDTESAAASLALHRNRGFIDAGRLRAVGFKHGRWLDTLLLQHSIADVTD